MKHPVIIEGFDTVSLYQASLGSGKKYVGQPGHCRFCGCNDDRAFKQKAHLIPEALGNKWLFSRDECDHCNSLFSLYDQALADAVGAILTLGATKGKGNRVRQTGRSQGNARIRHRRDSLGKRSLSVSGRLPDNDKPIRIELFTGTMVLETRLPPTPYRPRHAYKALCKMGLALVPKDELKHFQKLRKWLQDPADTLEFPVLPVTITFAMIGNAPQIATAILLRRRRSNDPRPYMFFMLSIGSHCFLIDLMPDALDNHIPPVFRPYSELSYQAIINGDDGDEIVIQYKNPAYLNWASPQKRPQPFEALETYIQRDFQTVEFKLRLRFDEALI
ncbi:hypothetical protein ACFFUB_05915 [Algimonas porphyrae]|nr:hypothetical protein [Algimonas porphyrae]